MKISEILRKLADLTDAIESGDQENQPDETDAMVPPLQQQIELQKKSVGVDNVYDEQDQETDELEVIKINAGV